jgi:hypothetical protein
MQAASLAVKSIWAILAASWELLAVVRTIEYKLSIISAPKKCTSQKCLPTLAFFLKRTVLPIISYHHLLSRSNPVGVAYRRESIFAVEVRRVRAIYLISIFHFICRVGIHSFFYCRWIDLNFKIGFIYRSIGFTIEHRQ